MFFALALFTVIESSVCPHCNARRILYVCMNDREMILRAKRAYMHSANMWRPHHIHFMCQTNKYNDNFYLWLEYSYWNALPLRLLYYYYYCVEELLYTLATFSYTPTCAYIKECWKRLWQFVSTHKTNYVLHSFRIACSSSSSDRKRTKHTHSCTHTHIIPTTIQYNISMDFIDSLLTDMNLVNRIDTFNSRPRCQHFFLCFFSNAHCACLIQKIHFFLFVFFFSEMEKKVNMKNTH